MRIDRLDDGDERPDAADGAGLRGADGGLDGRPGRNAVPDRGTIPDRDTAPDRDDGLAGNDGPDRGTPPDGDYGPDRDAAPDRGTARDRGAAAEWHGAGQGDDASAARVARNLEYRATVDAVFRAHAIDQGYARVKEVEEKTVTPAMRRIEAEDPDRHLAGLENRLKGKDRLTEKVSFDVEKKGRSVDEAFDNVKDAIRYTFVYDEEKYSAGVYADCERLENAGFGRFDRRNSWDADEYKGINSRWRIPGTNRMFEVQFHTQASLDAKEETHWAYERIRSAPDDAEVAQLHAYQRAVTSKVPIPPNAREIPDYRL